MANVGSLIIDLALESAQFINGLKQAQAATQQAAGKITSAMNFMKGAAIGFVGTLSVDLLSGQIQSAFDYADAIVDLGARTGASTKSIQEFRYAAQMTGSDFATADAAIEKYAKNFGSVMNGNDAMAKKFAELGVTSRDFDMALRQTIQGISKLPSVSQRNAAAFEIFGKSAATLTALMGEGEQGFDRLADAAASLGIVIADDVLQNAGQFNDQMDTMRMVLDAQMANVIVQNADAITQLGNAFIQAAGAAANFFSQMRVDSLMARRNGNLWTPVIDRITGTDSQAEASKELRTFTAGRSALYADNNRRYRAGIAQGRSPDEPYMQVLKGQNAQIMETELAARRAARRGVPTRSGAGGRLPTPTARSKTAPAPKAKPAERLVDQAELDRDWRQAQLRANNALLSAQIGLQVEPGDRFDMANRRLRNDRDSALLDIDRDTGTDKEVREGKRRYTKAQADELKLAEQAIFDAEYLGELRERDTTVAEQRLELSLSGLRNDADLLQSDIALARSSRDRRDASLKMVRNQFEQERLQLEAIRISETANKAEKAAAEARLKLLPQLQRVAETEVRRQNQSPLEGYLEAIPRTKNEINDALESVEVDGLKSLEDGLLGVIRGTENVGEAFGKMTDLVLDGLLRIGLQQMIIKPLGNLLFGGGDGGSGGIFGSIIKGITGGVKGARANGGYTPPGTYLVGERGPELATFGAPANVVPNRALRGFANDNNRGPVVNINGPITSNDPAMVRAMVAEGVLSAVPLITKQSTDATLQRLGRRSL